MNVIQVDDRNWFVDTGYVGVLEGSNTSSCPDRDDQIDAAVLNLIQGVRRFDWTLEAHSQSWTRPFTDYEFTVTLRVQDQPE